MTDGAGAKMGTSGAIITSVQNNKRSLLSSIKEIKTIKKTITTKAAAIKEAESRLKDIYADSNALPKKLQEAKADSYITSIEVEAMQQTRRAFQTHAMAKSREIVDLEHSLASLQEEEQALKKRVRKEHRLFGKAILVFLK